ncbi:phasin family protein [Phenylobacterium aquaticum]|uniref:phasin family protein n=1 Tax=Phenylobacterium aquaticum TaxID=1763816 RepID=UPI001F5DBD24|nr:hypothetical protein [Phenylobacterium aquaticum]MCI3134861.1 hypothetical protein [Phenylobacterium aquaticum]
MGTKQAPPPLQSDPMAATLAGLESMNTAMAEGMKQVRTLFETGVKTWEKEAGGFLEQMSADGAQAWRDLSRCKSPLEMLSVEQAWLSTRAKAYLEAGQRIAQSLDEAAKSAKPEGEAPPKA